MGLVQQWRGSGWQEDAECRKRFKIRKMGHELGAGVLRLMCPMAQTWGTQNLLNLNLSEEFGKMAHLSRQGDG